MDPFSTADDFYTLAEEQFDFDVSLSSESSREGEGEDEVFVGPVTDEGKLICVGVEHLAMDSVSSGPSSVAEEQMWSPCSGEDFDRVCSEAQKLSTRLKDHQPHTGQTDGTVPAERQDHMAVDFVQDTGAKLDMFSKPFNGVLSPIKRETICVQASPVKLLPPAIQKRLLKDCSSSSRSSVCSGVGVDSSRARLNTSSPASGSKTRMQAKMALRSKPGLGTSGILPSKPLVPATSSATSLKTAKTRAVPAENSSRLAPSSKVGLRSKAPPLQVRGVVDARRHAPSSSLSSLNSSMSMSPTGKGKLSASLNMSTSGPSSRAPTNMSRLASTSTTAAKTRRCTPVGRAADPPPPPTAAAATVRGLRRSFSLQSRKTSDITDPTKVARSTPVKRAVPSTPTPFQQSPSKRASVSSVSSQQQLGPRAKPMAFIAPNPSTRLRGLKRSESVVHSPDKLKIVIPMRLRSAGSLDSLLQEKVVPNSHLLHSTPSVSRIRRPSALPNPVNRSVISGIPAMTPKRLSGSGPADAFISARKTSNQSATRVESAASEEELVVTPKIHPFSLEDAEPAALQTQMQNEALTCVKVQSPEVSQEVVENMLPQQEVVENPGESVAPRQEVEENMESQKEVVENQEPEPSGNLIELHYVEEVISEDHGAKTEEILLLDVPVSLFKPEDKPLIDLSNTPDLIRTVSHKDGEMLIDLTSPLMKWSPDKKENCVNEAPLINFSF